MFKHLVLLALALLALGSSRANAVDGGVATVTVLLPAEAEVVGTDFVVGDVAGVYTADPLLASEVAAVSLGYAPAPGYSRLLHNHQVAMALRRAFPHVAWVFKGARAVRVFPRTERIAGQRLLEAALVELQRSSIQMDAEFQPAGVVADVAVPFVGAGATLRVEPQGDRLKSGTLSVPVLIELDGQVYRRVDTTWSVQVYQTLPVPVRSILAGEVLTDSLFSERRVLLDAVNTTPPLPLNGLRGATAARNLPADRPVTEMDIHRPVVVRSGEGLMVEVTKGAVTARVVGLALGSGAVDDRIPVRLRDTGREMLARVVSSELVRVDLGK